MFVMKLTNIKTYMYMQAHRNGQNKDQRAKLEDLYSQIP